MRLRHPTGPPLRSLPATGDLRGSGPRLGVRDATRGRSSRRPPAEDAGVTGQLHTNLLGHVSRRGFDDLQTIQVTGAQGIDCLGVRPIGGPEACQPAVLVIPHRPAGGPVGPREGPLAQPQLVADPFALAVSRHPGQVLGRHVQHQHHRCGVDALDGFEQFAGDPQLQEGPARGTGVLQPEHLGGHVGHLL